MEAAMTSNASQSRVSSAIKLSYLSVRRPGHPGYQTFLDFARGSGIMTVGRRGDTMLFETT